MSADPYRDRLKKAKWTWRESKTLNFLKSPRKKDKASGRSDKRAGRNQERKERDEC